MNKKIFKKKKLVNFWIEDEVWRDFKRVAEIEGVSASTLIRQFILKKVKNAKRQN